MFGAGCTARKTLALGFAILTALGFVLEVLVMEEVLFSRCKHEIRAALRAFDDSILKLRHIHCAP